MTTEEQWKEAMDAKILYEEEIRQHNRYILDKYKVPDKEMEYLLTGATISNKIIVVDKPQGIDQEEVLPFFSKIFIDQWAMGIEGDSFEGKIFAQLEKNKWLSIPFAI